MAATLLIANEKITTAYQTIIQSAQVVLHLFLWNLQSKIVWETIKGEGDA